MGDIQKTMPHALVGVLDIAHLGGIRCECKSIDKDGEYLRLPGLLASVCDRALNQFEARPVHAAAWNDSVCISVELKEHEDAKGVELTLELLDRLVRDLDHEICKWAHGLLIDMHQFKKKPAYLSELSGAHTAGTALVNATYGVIARGQLFPCSATPNASRNAASNGARLHWLHASSWAFADCFRIEKAVRECINRTADEHSQNSLVQLDGAPIKSKFYVDTRATKAIDVTHQWRLSLPLYPNSPLIYVVHATKSH